MYFGRYFFLILCSVLSVDAKIIYTAQGALNGTTMEARNGKVFNAFLGIPFAKPPVGKLRFQPPEPFGTWEGIKDCTIAPKCCLQWNKETNDGSLLGAEDCLFINVYTPLNTTKADRLPVIFYIYGGVFKTGSNVANGPQYIMATDVILVMPNHRGGAFGYLSTGDTVMPGNYGLKDQLLAMKWTRENIHHFGGDPNRVTLHGHSSGAMMAHMHMLSPQSKGYFQQAIIQSGNSYCEISYFDADITRSVAKEFAIRVNCSTDSSEEMLRCFMELDAEVLPRVGQEMWIWNNEPSAAFRPTVEDRRVKNAFLTDIPNKLKYHSPYLPMMIGITSGEGAMRTQTYFGGDGHLAKELNENFKTMLPISLQYLWHSKRKYLDYISVMIRTRYFGTKAINFDTMANLTEMYSDGSFGYCTVEAIRRYKGLQYVYIYDYASNYSITSSLENLGLYAGVGHADELPFIFYKHKFVSSFTHLDTTVSEELVKRWVNFVHTADPNKPVKINESLWSAWEPMKTKRIEYLRIRIHGTMETDLYEGKYKFWERLPLLSKYFKYF